MADRTKQEQPTHQVSSTADAGQAAHDAFRQEQAQGYRGVKADPVDNTAYTVQGVTGGQPTPETDPAVADEARRAVASAAVTGGEQA